MTDPASILDERLLLSPSVSLRPEPFGALAYHFGNRRLTFLKRPELVEVVRGLDGRRTLREVLSECGIPEWQWPAYDATLVRLMGSEMLNVVHLAAVGE
jgi:putative mycofactocin binding protein MftB